MDGLYEIPDFTGYYADRMGNIYSVLGRGPRNTKNVARRTAPVKLKYRLTRKGYARVYMRRESTGKREDIYVHRIIAEMFIENPNNYETVNHINCDKTDNRVENLEWMTRIDNVKYAMDVGILGRDKKGRFVNKLKEE